MVQGQVPGYAVTCETGEKQFHVRLVGDKGQLRLELPLEPNVGAPSPSASPGSPCC